MSPYMTRGVMSKRPEAPYQVGFGKPPRSTRFKPGQSGNPSGRPTGAKNFATAIEQELNSRVTVTENGRRRRISKREVIAKHLVNKAASGDLKAMPLLLNEARARQSTLAEAGTDEVFDTPQDQKVFEGIIARIRNSMPEGVPSTPGPEDDAGAIRHSNKAEG
jgi:hypothetical protein